MEIDKPKYILGISAYFHDSAAALVKDGKLICAIQEERITRKKHDDSLPVNAIRFCLEQAEITIDDVATIAYYEKPFLKFERLLEMQIAFYPKAFLPFRKTLKSWLREKLWVPHNIKKELGYKGDFFYAEHHESHAAAACYSSPFDSAAFLTLDGVGEWTCASFGRFVNNRIEILREQTYPHSVGMLYSAFTQYCGFKVNSGEYKLMGLAPYGSPIYADLIREKLVKISDDGSIQLELKYFEFHRGMRMFNSKFEVLFGKPKQDPNQELTQFYKDIAASIQSVLEDILLKSAQHIQAITGLDYLCYGGGVALNCKANQKLLESGIFKDVYIYGASGDSGGAVGAALLCSNQNAERQKQLISPYLGKSFTDDEITDELNKNKVVYKKFEADLLLNFASDELANGKVIAWFQGRDEMGPRALGNRSILASPIDKEMQTRINGMIKFREHFRPFAPVIMEEYSQDYFHNVRNADQMLFTFTTIKSETIPACVHVDKSARVQTVNSEQNALLYGLIAKFNQKTGISALINTSFNRRGEPMVHTPLDALRTFFGSGLDVLIIGSCVVIKNENPLVKIEEVEIELD